MAMLLYAHVKARIDGPADQRRGRRDAAADHIDPAKIEGGDIERQPDNAEGDDRGRRAHGDDAAQHLGGFLARGPLQHQGFLHGCVVVIADRHQHRRAIEADHGREPAGHRRADAEQQQGGQRQGLFAHEDQNEHRREGHEARHFAQGLEDADFGAGEAGAIDDEVVQQGVPGGEAQGHGPGHHQDHRLGPAPTAGEKFA